MNETIALISSIVSFFGQRALALFGATLGGGRNVNGDGIPDLVVGAPNDDQGMFTRSGSAQVYSGSTGRLFCFFDGDNDSVVFGGAVDLVGDVDGDGLADLAVGAAYDSDVNTQSGSAQVFAGNDLFLQAESPVAKEGLPFGLDVRGGGAASPFAIFLMEFDGSSLVIPIVVGTLDGNGEATFRATVPTGFGTHDLGFIAFACDNPAVHRGVAASALASVHTTP